MKVLINGLQAGNKSGTGAYTRRLIPALLDLEENLELVVAWPKSAPMPKRHARLTIVPIAGPPLRRLWFDQIGFRRLRKKYDANLVHFPATIGPFFTSRGTVLTVHDLGFEHHPEWFRPERAFYYRTATRISARLATRLLADSENTARDLQNEYHVPTDRIDVAPLGVGSDYYPANFEAKDRVRKKYDLPDEFFLYLGTLEPRKNLPRLIEAWSNMAGENPYDLVIAGREGWKVGPIKQAIAASPHRERIHRIGFVDEDDVAPLISAAETFVWPSLFEGFGLPVLEAMACGTPVLSSAGGAIEEVAGEAARLVQPKSVQDIEVGLRELSKDEALRAALRKKGIERAAQFTWKHTAERTFQCYRKALLQAQARPATVTRG